MNILKSTSFYASQQYEKALSEAFKKVDEVINSSEGEFMLKKLRGENSAQNNEIKISKGTGCTANVVLITSDSYFVANAGDSRSSLCRKGKAFDLSVDHKPESEE